MPPTWILEGTQSLAVEGVGEPIQTTGQNTLGFGTLYIYAVLFPKATFSFYSCCKYFYVYLFAISKCKHLEEKKLYNLSPTPFLRYSIHVHIVKLAVLPYPLLSDDIHPGPENDNLSIFLPSVRGGGEGWLPYISL